MKKRKWWVIALIVIGVVLLISVAVGLIKYFTGYRVYRDVRYSDGENCVMDIYIPDRAYERETNGAVLFIHGGSWSSGTKSEEEGKCRLLASHGYITASIGYTLRNDANADEYNVSLVLDEIDAALLKLKSFTLEEGITVDKAATSGYSAGAHLALLYAYSRAETAPIDILFTAGMAGPSDMSVDVWGEELSMAITTMLTGENVTRDMLYSEKGEQLINSISPIYYVNERSAPTLIIQGGKDTVVPEANADNLLKRLSEFSVKNEYIYMDRSSHMLIENPIGRFRYYKRLIDYAKEYFG